MSGRRDDDLPELFRGALHRTAKLTGLPLGAAGRAMLGLGQRLGGRPAAAVSAELQERTAAQVFAVLGELKGGAMKVGQTLSVLEAALPADLAGPYRAALTKLQEAAPSLPPATLHAVLTKSFGADWRTKFHEFDEVPVAAASIGQVHRAVWPDGRRVAVKVQYPGARQAVRSDLRQLRRMAGPLGVFAPGLDVRALATEAEARMEEELDYELEATRQRTFANAFAGDPDFVVPSVVAQSGDVLVTDWVDGVPLADIVEQGSAAQRDRAGLLLVRLLLRGPARAGLLHADPHPGNFRLIPDGDSWKLGVLDFGAVDSLPDGLPAAFGQALRMVISGDVTGSAEALISAGFLRPGADPAVALDLLRPMSVPAAEETFTFSRGWLREQAAKAAATPRAASRQLDLPPDCLLIHRVASGTIAMLCQLGSTASFRAELRHDLPGFIESGLTAGSPAPA